MQSLCVDLGERSYSIHIGPALIDRLGERLAHLAPTTILLVSNTTVAPLYAPAAMRSLR